MAIVATLIGSENKMTNLFIVRYVKDIGAGLESSEIEIVTSPSIDFVKSWMEHPAQDRRGAKRIEIWKANFGAFVK